MDPFLLDIIRLDVCIPDDIHQGMIALIIQMRSIETLANSHQRGCYQFYRYTMVIEHVHDVVEDIMRYSRVLLLI